MLLLFARQGEECWVFESPLAHNISELEHGMTASDISHRGTQARVRRNGMSIEGAAV
jgi:hypothetical protein